MLASTGSHATAPAAMNTGPALMAPNSNERATRKATTPSAAHITPATTQPAIRTATSSPVAHLRRETRGGEQRPLAKERAHLHEEGRHPASLDERRHLLIGRPR